MDNLRETTFIAGDCVVREDRNRPWKNVKKLLTNYDNEGGEQIQHVKWSSIQLQITEISISYSDCGLYELVEAIAMQRFLKHVINSMPASLLIKMIIVLLEYDHLPPWSFKKYHFSLFRICHILLRPYVAQILTWNTITC